MIPDLTKYPETCPDCKQPARAETADDGRLSTETWYFCVNAKCWCYDAKNLGKGKLQARGGSKPKTAAAAKRPERVCQECGSKLSEGVAVKDGSAFREFFCKSLSCPRSHELAAREQMQEANH